MSNIVEVKEWVRPDRIAIKQEAGWRYRWIRKEDVKRRMEEGNGWEIVTDPKTHLNPEAPAVDRASHYRGLILMRVPSHIAEQRDAFYQNKHNRRMRATLVGAGITNEADKVNRGAGGKLTGTIGTVTATDVVENAEGKRTKSETQIDPRDVHPDDLREAASVKAAQAAEVAGAKQVDGEPPVEKQKQRRKRK